MVFHNRPSYDYHFFIKKQAKVFEGEFNCLVENTKIKKFFSVPIKKEFKKIGKNGKETTKTISYILQLTDSMTFMASFLLNLADNYAE